MQLEVINIEGKSTGRTVELPESIFGIEPNDHVLYLAVKQYLAAQRQGTNKVKTRAEVKGSSKKLVKQKGTGGARKGNLRSPIYKGGGTIFGPKPRNYNFKLNRKVKDLAKCSALAYKAKDNAIVILEDLQMDTPKTKTFLNVLKNLNIANKKTLFVTADENDNVELSLRNLYNVLGTQLVDINTYDVMNADVLVLTENAAKIFSEENEVA
jgi:large subunit ribosomal protein L4